MIIHLQTKIEVFNIRIISSNTLDIPEMN